MAVAASLAVAASNATTRSYLEKHPADWSTTCGLAVGAKLQVVNSDLSTITTEADKVLLVEGLIRWLIHTVALLAGLRYKWESIKHWFQGVTTMRESSMYQGLLEEGRAEGEAKGRAEGRAEEARRILLLLGEHRFGPADAATRATLGAMANLEQLERWTERLLSVSSWAELLTEP